MYKVDLHHESTKSILNYVYENEVPVDIFEGTLLDNFIIYNHKFIKFKGKEPTDFIILRVKYLNEWSSVTEMILTDDQSVVDHYLELWDSLEE